MYKEITLNYNGYTYTVDLDFEPDNVKRFHTVTKPDGSKIDMDWSPYSMPTQSEFELFVDLGCPDRSAPELENNSGSLRSESLRLIASKRARQILLSVRERNPIVSKN